MKNIGTTTKSDEITLYGCKPILFNIFSPINVIPTSVALNNKYHATTTVGNKITHRRISYLCETGISYLLLLNKFLWSYHSTINKFTKNKYVSNVLLKNTIRRYGNDTPNALTMSGIVRIRHAHDSNIDIILMFNGSFRINATNTGKKIKKSI